MKRALIILGCVLVVVIAGIAIARADAPRWHRWHRGFPLAYVSHQLNLSGAQESQIKTIMQGERPAVAILVREFAAEGREMDAATAQGNADEARVQEIAARQGATLAKFMVEKEHVKTKIYTTVLTADQRTKADELLSKWPSHLEKVADRLERDGRN